MRTKIESAIIASRQRLLAEPLPGKHSEPKAAFQGKYVARAEDPSSLAYNRALVGV